MDKNKTPSRWYSTQHPTHFQGWRKTKNYFEGWYFKITDPERNLALAFIPGISMTVEGEKHCFIQVLDGLACKSAYHTFDIDAFVPSKNKLEIRIGENYFSTKELRLNLPEIQGNLDIDKTTAIPRSVFSPGIMGWYSFVPFMQCYHGLVSMDHHVTGELNYKNESYNLDAKGYIEKDWGSSFPKAWIWNQCNNFSNNDQLSSFASVAHIPWGKGHFIGFLSVLYYEGKTEIFATYNNSKRTTRIDNNKVIFSFTKKNKKLEIIASREKGSDLFSPISGSMTGKVNESMQAKVNLKYWIDDVIVIEDDGQYSGLEIAGPSDILLK
jgi:hypothetical protein